MGNSQALPDGDRPERSSAQSTEVTAEEVSLLVDGELDADRVERVCHGLRAPAAVETWVCYHVIGDAMRGQCKPIHGFAQRFSTRLAAEPTVLAPQRPRPAPAAVALAIAATVTAVAVVGWVALTTMPAGNEVVATAQQASAVRPADARRPVVNEYLLAHQEYSPATAIAGVRPYLRAVAADDQDGSR
ncbi:MAG TPA: sigma-E factor negative regulatory protein [Casimicrobiaceae bacterium]|nr:sigma-E factor negative regulatory protein [Casimicrobiaceae bacterium]